MDTWDKRASHLVHGGSLHREGGYVLYLDWLQTSTHLKLKVEIDSYQIEDLPSYPQDVFDEYDEITWQGTQPERGPLQDYVVS